MNNLFHQSIYDVYSMVSIIKFYVKSYFRASLQLEKDDDFVKFINPCTRRETSALGDPNMRNLKQGEIIQLERKGYYRCDVPLFGRPNPLFFLQYQMADNSPQQTRSPVWFLEHMNYKIQFVRFSGHRWLNYVVIQESCNDQILEVRMRDISVSVSTVMLSFACLSANC